MVEAERLAEAAVQEAAARGRPTVRIIHGSSTTDRCGPTPTIKTALRAMLDEGAFAPDVTSSFRGDGHLLLCLSPARQPDPTRLTLRDIW